MKQKVLLLTASFVLLFTPAVASRQVTKLRLEIVTEAFRYEKYPYEWGGKGAQVSKSFDCSGFVNFIFTKFFGPGHYPSKVVEAVTYRNLLAARDARIDCAQSEPADLVYFPKQQGLPKNHIGIIVEPERRTFITAQGPRVGVEQNHFGPGAKFWGPFSYECYRNVWVDLR